MNTTCGWGTKGSPQPSGTRGSLGWGPPARSPGGCRGTGRVLVGVGSGAQRAVLPGCVQELHLWVPGHGSADEPQPWLLLLPGEGVSEPRAALGGVLNPNSLHEGLPGPCGHRDVTAGLCQPASWGTSSRCLLCRGLGAPSGCGNVRNGAAGGIKKEKIEKEQAGRDSPVLLPGEGRVRCIFPVPSGARPSRGQGSWA